MGKRETVLYFFTETGSVISTKRLKSLKKLLPSVIDIERRRLICKGQNISYEPFIVELTEEQGSAFCEELVGKCNGHLPSKFLFLHSSNPFSECNPPIAEIVINLKEK